VIAQIVYVLKYVSLGSKVILSTICVDGEKEKMDEAVTIVEPVAKEFIEKWKKENKEQVKAIASYSYLVDCMCN